MTVAAFIDSQRADHDVPVTVACRVLGVSAPAGPCRGCRRDRDLGVVQPVHRLEGGQCAGEGGRACVYSARTSRYCPSRTKTVPVLPSTAAAVLAWPAAGRACAVLPRPLQGVENSSDR